MSVLDAEPLVIDRSGGGTVVRGAGYVLTLPRPAKGFPSAPYAILADADGTPWLEPLLLASVHTVRGPDETLTIDEPVVEQRDGVVEIRVGSRSTAWRARTTVLVCTPRTVEVRVEVEGDGDLDDVVLFGGDAVLPTGASGSFFSGIAFRSVFVPAPTQPVQVVRPAHAGAVLGAVGDSDPGRLHGIFSPPPLVLGLGRPAALDPAVPGEGAWLGMAVRSPVEALTCTAVHYEPLDGGFRIRLPYEGHTRVRGSWMSPTMVLRPAESAYEVVTHYREDLEAHGLARRTSHRPADWWFEPIFCGWGAQCARALHLVHSAAAPTAPTAPESEQEEGSVVAAAPQLASAVVYDQFLALLDEHDLDPGTIVIDDRWQAEYGAATVDTRRWPDLKAWIAARHDEGRRVLLWWKAWDPEGLPAEECITDTAGRPVAADPGHPRYRERVRSVVARLLGGDGLDADGFKVDFTQRTPSGRTLRGGDGCWGIAGLHLLLSTLYEAAKAAKPDALVVAHAVHPSFGDVADMVRLNDVLKGDLAGRQVPVVEQMRFRHDVAIRALPDMPIDTDQWPMPSRAEWLQYAEIQPSLGVPALYYLETIDRSGERIEAEDLAVIRRTWRRYRAARS